jgi:hypothetical protein
MRLFLITVFSFAMLSTSASADYLVKGRYTATICKGLGIEYCSEYRVDAVGKSGQLFALPTRYPKVDEYKASQSLCWLRVRSGWFNWAVGDIPTFYRYTGGPVGVWSSYEELSTPDYVTFPCVKSN